MFLPIVLLSMLGVLTACLFFPFTGFQPLLAKTFLVARKNRAVDLPPNVIQKSVGAMAANDFLLQLQREIEMELHPRPTDSVLRRHYDSLVAMKIKDRLGKMPV